MCINSITCTYTYNFDKYIYLCIYKRLKTPSDGVKRLQTPCDTLQVPQDPLRTYVRIYTYMNTYNSNSSRSCNAHKTRCLETLSDSATMHSPTPYGVALVSRIDKMVGLFCKRAL